MQTDQGGSFLDTLMGVIDSINGVIWADWVLYTVLGVGNRHGAYIQLLGCCIAVIGMIYAFYIKPVIKQRERKRIYESAGLSSVAGGGAS